MVRLTAERQGQQEEAVEPKAGLERLAEATPKLEQRAGRVPTRNVASELLTEHHPSLVLYFLHQILVIVQEMLL